MWMKGVEVDKHPEQERSAQTLPLRTDTQDKGTAEKHSLETKIQT